MANFFIIRNKEKNMYYWGDGSWTKSKDCAKKYQHKDCAEILMQIDRLDYKICEVIEIPSIADLEAKLAESEKENERIKKNWQISKTHQQKLYNNLKQQNKEKGIVNYPITLDGCRIANEEQLLDFAKDFCLEKKYWKKQLAESNELRIATKWKVDDLEKQLTELIKEKQKDLTIKEILIELMKADTDNCEVKFKSGDLEFTLDITITKIVKGDVVEYDASEEKADE